MGNIEIAELQKELINVLCKFAKNDTRTVAVKKVIIDFDKTHITYVKRDDFFESAPELAYDSDTTDVYLNKYGE